MDETSPDPSPPSDFDADSTPDPAPDHEAGAERGPMPAFAELARIAVDTVPLEQTLRGIAELAKQSLSGVEDVSLTMIDQGEPRSAVFTGPLAITLDERQYELGFGPCLDAARTGQTVVVDTESADTPYREFARIAGRAGVRHIVSVGMPIAQRSIGGLNIYRTADGGFRPAFLEQAQVFAGYAAIAVNNVTSYAAAVSEAEQLREAMRTRAVIEQAKGMIMTREHCTPDEAFELLSRISQHRNIKLHDIAQSIVDSVQRHHP